MTFSSVKPIDLSANLVYRFENNTEKDVRIKLNRECGKPIYRQVYDALKRFVFEGELPPGTKMPSSRELSSQLEVARSTVTLAYDHLLADGYFQVYSGRGTFVSRELPAVVVNHRRRSSVLKHKSINFSYPLSAYGDFVNRPKDDAHECELMCGGSIAVDHFPLHEWNQLLFRRCRAFSSAVLECAEDPAGYAPLRAAIADYLCDTRGLVCTPSQILITNGSQQALDLIARIHIQSGDNVAMEDPGYFLAAKAFAACGANLVPLPVDRFGLVTQQLEMLNLPLKVLHVTPSHQFPLGGTLPLSRRMVLLEWAYRTNTILIEDDYDSEFRFQGRPLSSLHELDSCGSVIYTGSLSRVLYPALRLAYMVLPPALMNAYVAAKRLTDQYSHVLQQMALYDFIEQGCLHRHIKQMRSLQRTKQEDLIMHLKDKFADHVSIIGEESGLHLVLSFMLTCNEDEIVNAAAVAGIPLRSTKQAYLKAERPAQEFVLSYFNISESTIAEKIARFAETLGL